MANFTYELATTLGEREIVALHPAGEVGPYAAEVRRRIRRETQADYGYMARTLNDSGVNTVSLHYLPAIWGGDGSYVLDFVRALTVPMVATVHDAAPQPSSIERQTMAELADAAEMVVVMSEAAAVRLKTEYGIAADRIEIIPHGVWDLPLVEPEAIKTRLGLKGQTLVLSFGLMRPGKGFETVVEAMPAVIEAVPSARYVIVAPPSPDGVEGEVASYRAAIESRIAELKLGESVKIMDKYLGRVELATWIEAADVVVAPSLELDRTVSGTLACAMGAGRPIISTPSAYAKEMLALDRGRLVAPSQPAPLASEIVALLGDDDERTAMGRRAYAHAREMVWWQVAARYRLLFDQVSRARHARSESPMKKLRSVSESGRLAS